MSDETRDVREWSDEKLLDILDEMAAKRWVVSSTDRDALREAARRLREGPDVREAYREVPDVERAFREGYGYGFDAGELGASYYGNRDTMDADEAWQESDARAALSEREREPGGSCRICGRPVSGVTICEYCDRMMESLAAPGLDEGRYNEWIPVAVDQVANGGKPVSVRIPNAVGRDARITIQPAAPPTGEEDGE